MVGGQCVACEGNANPDNFYTLVGIVMGIIGFLFLLVAILGPYCYFKRSRRVEDEVTDSRLQDNKTEAANDKAKMKAKTKILTGAVGEQISTNDNLSTGQQAPDAPAPKAPSLKKQKTVKMEGTQTNFQAFIKVLKWMKSEKLKIAFSFFQVLNVFESNFSIPWPQDVAAILSGIKMINLSFAEALRLGCYASNGNFYTTFSIMMFTPIVLTAFIALVCIFGLCYAKCRRKADKLNWVALCFRFWGLMVFAIFPSLNSILFQVFESVNVDGHWFLRRDMTINCDADNQERTNMLVIACFCVLLYPIGTLSMFGLILIRFRNYMASMYIVHNEDGAPLFRGPSMDPKSDLHARMPHNTVVRAIGKNRMTVTTVHGEEWIQFLWKADWDGDGDEEEVKVWTQLSDNRSNQLYIKSNAWFFLTDAFGWLYAAYEGQFYFWELIEFGRKLLLSAIIIFCYPGTPLQIIIGLLIMVCFLWALSTFKPYEDDSDDTAQGLSFFALTVTLLCGLAFRIQQETAASNDPNNGMKNLILTVVIFAMNGFLFLAAFGIVIINVLPLLKEKLKKKEAGVVAKLDPSASEPTTVMINMDKHPFQVQYNGEWYNVKWLADFPEDAPQTGMYGPLEITRVNHFRRGQVWLSDNSCFENPSERMSAKSIQERQRSFIKSDQVAPDDTVDETTVSKEEEVVAL